MTVVSTPDEVRTEAALSTVGRDMRPVDRLGLRARATLAWSTLACLLVGGAAVLAYELTRRELLDDRRTQATAQTYVNARLLRSGLRASDPDVTEILASLGSNTDGVAVARVGDDWFTGSVATTSEDVPAPLVRLVGDGRAGRQHTTVAGVPYLAVGVPVVETGAAYFEMASLADIDASLDSLARRLTLAAAVTAALAAGTAWWVSGRVLRPLHRTAVAAEDIAHGHLGIRLEGTTDPDLAPLQRSFNTMADTIEERIERERRFTSDVSHELRSPVAALLSGISIAQRRARRGDDVLDALDDLERRAQVFNAMVVDLLEISRADAGAVELQREAIDPVELTHAVLAIDGHDDVPVDVDASTPPVVHADKRRLGRMVMNLVENADRYAGGATKVSLSGGSDVLRLAVDDDGAGVPEHERRHVFGRFARGDGARASTVAGTGLGLSLVAEHARLHGGRAWVEDAPGGGARFVIELPVGEAVDEESGR